MNLKLSHVVHWPHSIINLVLALVPQWAINCFVIDTSTSILLIQVGIIQLLIQNATEGLAWVEFDPGWRQHEVDVALKLIAPEFDHSSQVELTDNFVRLDQSVHVSFETMVGVDALLVKLDLDEAIRVCSNDEVDLRPIHHDDLFNIIDDVW